MYKYIYPLIKWKIKPWLKYYIVKKGEGTPSEIITSASPITLVNSLRKKFIKFIVGGNSIQDGEPSPTNEVPIQNVTGNVEVKVENKNILNLNVEGILAVSIDTAIKKDNNIYIKTNTKYVASYRIPVKYKLNEPMTISFDAQFLKTLDIPNHNSLVYFRKGNMTKGAIGLRNNKNKNSYSITLEEGLDEEGYTFWIYLKTMQTDEAKEVEIQFENLQIEYGTKATTPVPHEEQTAIFPLEEGQVLHEGDTIEDKIVQRRGTYQFTGNENWTKSGNTTSISFCCYTNSIRPLAKNNGTVGLLNIGKVCNYQAISGYKNAFAYNVGNSHFLKIEKTAIPNWDESLTDAEKVTLFKAYLAEQYANGTPVTLEYELAEPIEIPFTEAQRTAKAQIDSLHSYKGTTYISSDNEPSPIFEVQYYMEGE